MKSYWIKVSTNPTTGVLMRRKNRDTDTHIEKLVTKTGRSWSHVAASQGMLSIAGNE